jgi:hypothetical protein
MKRKKNTEAKRKIGKQNEAKRKFRKRKLLGGVLGEADLRDRLAALSEHH